jgi:hypothetical protein
VRFSSFPLLNYPEALTAVFVSRQLPVELTVLLPVRFSLRLSFHSSADSSLSSRRFCRRRSGCRRRRARLWRCWRRGGGDWGCPWQRYVPVSCSYNSRNDADIPSPVDLLLSPSTATRLPPPSPSTANGDYSGSGSGSAGGHVGAGGALFRSFSYSDFEVADLSSETPVPQQRA